VSASGPDEATSRPLLRIVRGNLGPEEIAALVAVLAAASTAGGQPEAGQQAPASQWAPPARLLRPDVHPSGWWASSLPR
jgi:hypothetical protein